MIDPTCRFSMRRLPIHFVDAIKRGLAVLGWIEGCNIRFAERSSDNDGEIALYAAELARLAPDAIFVTASEPLAAIDIIDERRSDILTLGSHPSPRARSVGGITACGRTVVRHYFHSGRQRDRLAAVQKIQ
jgi:hypothetical protein